MNETSNAVEKGSGRAMGLRLVTMLLGAIALAAPLVTGLSVALLVGLVVLLGIKLFLAGLIMLTLGSAARTLGKQAGA